MAVNILKVDIVANRILKSRTTDIPSCGAIALFDSKALLPSSDHAFLIAALQKYGLHENWVCYIQKPRVRNDERVGNPDSTDGFVADTGIRQVYH